MKPDIAGLHPARACMAVLLLATVLAHAQPVPQDEAAFTEYVARALRLEAGDQPVVVKGMRSLGLGPLQANLDRIYRFCLGSCAECAAEVERYVRGVVQVAKERSIPPDKAAIYLVVRTSAYVERARAAMGKDAPALQMRPLAEGWVTLVVLDTPRAVRPLHANDLKLLNLTEDQLFDVASQNLHNSLKPLAEVAKPVTSGQIGSVTGSVFDVGRLALPADWGALAAAQNGTLLVAMPATDVVLYSADATPVGIEALRTLAQRTASKAPNPLSAAVLRWTPQGWELMQ